MPMMRNAVYWSVYWVPLAMEARTGTDGAKNGSMPALKKGCCEGCSDLPSEIMWEFITILQSLTGGP